jgi:ring-1,2-phenylacetyl-CoA epoxidase subunit PaaB
MRRAHIDPQVHVGSLLAPSPDVALILARENFMRRDSAVSIWVVPSKQITEATNDSNFFSREMDRKYREVAGYTENGRLWRMFKEKALTLEEIVAYVEGRNEEGKQAKKKAGRG